jgi:hypothetical protein
MALENRKKSQFTLFVRLADQTRSLSEAWSENNYPAHRLTEGHLSKWRWRMFEKSCGVGPTFTAKKPLLMEKYRGGGNGPVSGTAVGSGRFKRGDGGPNASYWKKDVGELSLLFVDTFCCERKELGKEG